jgi:hypothetical protein
MTTSETADMLPPNQGEAAQVAAYEQAVVTVKAALPMLEWQRDHTQVVTFRAPPGSGLPAETVTVEPYYFFRSDPAHVGAWKLRQDGQDTVYVSSLPRPTAENDADVKLGAKMSRDGSAYGEVSLDRALQCAGLLRIAMAEFTRLQPPEQAAAVQRAIPQPRRFGGLNRVLGIRHRIAH